MKNETKQSIISDLSNADYTKGKNKVFKELSKKYSIGYYAIRYIYRNNEKTNNKINYNKNEINSHVKESKVNYYHTLPNKEYITKPLNYTITSTNDTQEIIKDTNVEINTIDDLIKELNIDINIWDIETWTFRKREVIVNKDQVEPLWSLSVKLKKKKNTINYLEEFKEFVKEIKFTDNENNNCKSLDSINDDKLLVINIFDLHLAKFAWNKETGEDYDLRIAKNRFLNAISYFTNICKQNKIHRIILCNGGDFLHTDTHNSTTTGGTYVESDNRYQKIFKEGLSTLIEGINRLSYYAPVTFINIQGNHDKQTSYYLGVALEAYYSFNNRITIKNEPTLRKYYTFGKTSLMFTHGDKAVDRLPLVFAVEHKDFSISKFREIHAGHLHKSAKKFYAGEDEFNGVLVRNYNSLCGNDSWHTENGFVGSVKKATALIYDKELGRTAEFYYTI